MYTSLSPPPRAAGIHSTGRADLPGSKWPFAGQAYCRPASGARGKGAAPLPGAAALPQYVAKKNFTRISSSIFRLSGCLKLAGRRQPYKDIKGQGMSAPARNAASCSRVPRH